MQEYKLTSIYGGKTIFKGRFYSFTACLEQAIKDRVNLSGINLSHKNLSNANLDDGMLERADFSGTNLTGANLSDAALHHANFNGAALYNTFFCYSDIYSGNFENAFFGATDIFGADISHARFSTLSCFSLEFARARRMHGCRFTGPDGHTRKMSRPPVIIRGLGKDPIIVLDESAHQGMNVLPHEKLHRIAEKLYAREYRRRLLPRKAG